MAKTTIRSQKRLRAEQFNRACDLRLYLDRYVGNFGGELRLSTDATESIVNWLNREYNLGIAAHRRRSR